MDILEITKKIPVTENVDVAVCGAGSAGWIAAVAAARAGLSVLLVDRYGFPGGTATAGYVLPISGAFHGTVRMLSEIPFGFVKRMEKAGAAQFEMPKGHISFDPEYYKVIAAEMLSEAGVKYLSNTYITGCLCEDTGEGRRITHITVCGKSGDEAIAAKIFIDATGDGDIAAYAGVPMQEENPLRQPLSLCFALSGVDTSTELLKNSIHHDGRHGGSQNNVIREFLLGESDIGDFCGPWFNTSLTGNTVVVNITRADCDATDSRAYAAAERRLREDMLMITDKLKAKYPEFAGCGIAASAFNAGIRETRRIRGKYTFTADDILNGTEHPCPVAGCAHPIDIHARKGGGQTLIRLENHSYIPYASMVAEGYPNLIVAGRCISVDPVALASVRVQATCMTMGEAAGLAAAFCMKNNVPTYSADNAGFSVKTLFDE
ncbi:MAG: FAD-dependent oxidoreductase [Clostridia bacterium]|nr:FAD-dependent oxidoreductase [Clostridia bacterium]